MKVVDILKHKSESLAKKHQIEFRDLMSPALREYWSDFVSKAQAQQIFPWINDLHKPAVNETQEPVIQLSQEAQALYLELSQKLGEEIHVGDWATVDQARIDSFGAVTEDMQWIHTDPERASHESPFKTTVAHGFLTLSMLPKLTDSVDPEKPQFPTAKMTVNIGLNEVRFPYPVKAGNNIRARSKLLKVTPVKKGLEIEREIKVEIDGVRRPGLIAVSVIRLVI
ncbi:MaoC family dehydratase [Vibrio sp. SCSIO 43136]|uniref:MaoC family dehydratase n=1 Tax=Vibrio sp. SCSIO 43136 TaxID=2819101 RepID=UPI002074D69A|nr:MaoC family dehydratase [Vibrio sp. SCSIO 43136]USD68030.1 MaoC family dehydratase [Vibrio sp. SCSIO 43136]